MSKALIQHPAMPPKRKPLNILVMLKLIAVRQLALLPTPIIKIEHKLVTPFLMLIPSPHTPYIHPFHIKNNIIITLYNSIYL